MLQDDKQISVIISKLCKMNAPECLLLLKKLKPNGKKIAAIQGERRRCRANTGNSNEKTDNFGDIAFRIPIELAYIVQDGRSASIRAGIWAKTSLGDLGASILVTAMESRVIIGSEIQSECRRIEQLTRAIADSGIQDECR